MSNVHVVLDKLSSHNTVPVELGPAESVIELVHVNNVSDIAALRLLDSKRTYTIGATYVVGVTHTEADEIEVHVGSYAGFLQNISEFTASLETTYRNQLARNGGTTVEQWLPPRRPVIEDRPKPLFLREGAT